MLYGFSRRASDRQLTMCNVNDVVQETITLLGDRFLQEVEVQFTPAPDFAAGSARLQKISSSKSS